MNIRRISVQPVLLSRADEAERIRLRSGGSAVLEPPYTILQFNLRLESGTSSSFRVAGRSASRPLAPEKRLHFSPELGLYSWKISRVEILMPTYSLGSGFVVNDDLHLVIPGGARAQTRNPGEERATLDSRFGNDNGDEGDHLALSHYQVAHSVNDSVSLRADVKPPYPRGCR